MATVFTVDALRRLASALGLSLNTTDLTISIPADGLAQMTVTRILDQEEIDALSQWFITEGVEAIQTGTTTYSLKPREVQP